MNAIVLIVAAVVIGKILFLWAALQSLRPVRLASAINAIVALALIASVICVARYVW